MTTTGKVKLLSLILAEIRQQNKVAALNTWGISPRVDAHGVSTPDFHDAGRQAKA